MYYDEFIQIIDKILIGEITKKDLEAYLINSFDLKKYMNQMICY